MASKSTCLWFFGIFLVVMAMMNLHQFTPKSSTHNFHNIPISPPMSEELVKAIARQIKEQLYSIKTLIPIAESKKEVRDRRFARVLNDQNTAAELMILNAKRRNSPLTLEESETLIYNMTMVLSKAHQLYHNDIVTTISTLKEKTQSLEKVLRYHEDHEFPTALHCMTAMLVPLNPTVSLRNDLATFQRKLVNNRLRHFCIFSANIIATSVVVNSTITNSKRSERVVFRIVTDDIHYESMIIWFSNNNFRGATIDIKKAEDLIDDCERLHGQIPFIDPTFQPPNKLEYLRFYIPDFFPTLNKLVLLEEDVIVQKDLAPLFELDLHGKVMGAVQRCKQNEKYINFFNLSRGLRIISPYGCAWAYGVVIYNLTEWRIRKLTNNYHYWMHYNDDDSRWNKTIHRTLPAALITFDGVVKNLDSSWHIRGLGYKRLASHELEIGAVLQFDGNSKPWLGGNPTSAQYETEKYRPLWNKYLNASNPIWWKCFRE